MKRLGLVFLFFLGISFQECDPCRCGEVDEYFDIEGLNVAHYGINPANGSMEVLDNAEAIPFNNYHQLNVNYEIQYVSQTQPTSFSLMPSAYACSCLEPGSSGSKHEELADLVIITLNDFDSTHRAGQNITELFTIQHNNEDMSIDQYLNLDTGRIRTEGYALKLTKAPQSDPNFAVEIKVTLTNEERYSAKSNTVRFATE